MSGARLWSIRQFREKANDQIWSLYETSEGDWVCSIAGPIPAGNADYPEHAGHWLYIVQPKEADGRMSPGTADLFETKQIALELLRARASGAVS